MKIKKRNQYIIYPIYILFCLIIFQSGTVQAAINSDSFMFKATRLIMIMLAMDYGIKGFQVLSRKMFVYFLALFAVLESIALINFLLYSDSWAELQYKIFLFLLFFLFISWCNKKKVRYLQMLYTVLVSIAYATLFFYIVIEILKLPIPYSIMHEDGSSVYYKNYLNLFYSYSIAFPPRICGFFWEPGVNQIYLNFALLLFYLLDKDDKFQLFILVLSIGLTQSSSGYIIMFILLAAIIAKRSKIKNDFYLRLLMLVFGVVGALLAFFVKMKATNVIGDSFSMRANDLITGFKLFLQHPFIGIGFYNTSIFSKVSYYKGGNSNGLLTIMYTTGLIGLMFLCIPFIYRLALKTKLGEKRKTLIFFFFVLAINFTEPIYSLPIMMFILAFAYAAEFDTNCSLEKLKIIYKT